jgi:hypothetical protein
VNEPAATATSTTPAQPATSSTRAPLPTSSTPAPAPHPEDRGTPTRWREMRDRLRMVD